MSEANASCHCGKAPKAPRDKWRHTITSLDDIFNNKKKKHKYHK